MTDIPFIDLAVTDGVREALMQGSAVLLIADSDHDLVWANTQAARLFGHATGDDLTTSGLAGLGTARRQLTSALNGGAGSVLVRLRDGLRTRLVSVTTSRIQLPDGRAAHLLTIEPDGAESGDQALAALVGLAGDDAGCALVDAHGSRLAENAGFNALGLDSRLLAGLASETARQDDRMVKRFVWSDSAEQTVGLGIGRLQDEPARFLVVGMIADTAAEPASTPVPATTETEHNADPAGTAFAASVVAGTAALGMAADGSDDEPSIAPQSFETGLTVDDEPSDEAPAVDPDDLAEVFEDHTEPGGHRIGDDEALQASTAVFGDNMEAVDDDDAADGEATEAEPETLTEADADTDAEAAVFAGLDAASGPVRFVWKTDADDCFSEVAAELAATVGPNAVPQIGEPFDAMTQRFDLDPNGEIRAALGRRDTWSGRSVLWPVENTDLRVPVDLAALPFYNRDRVFEGYRGFGIIRTGDAVIDPNATGQSLGALAGASTDASAEPEELVDQTLEAGADLVPDRSTDTAPEDRSDAADDPFDGEVPALSTSAMTPLRRAADRDKVVDFSSVRSWQGKQPASLDARSRANFEEIGRHLGPMTDENDLPADEDAHAIEGTAQESGTDALPGHSLVDEHRDVPSEDTVSQAIKNAFDATEAETDTDVSEPAEIGHSLADEPSVADDSTPETQAADDDETLAAEDAPLSAAAADEHAEAYADEAELAAEADADTPAEDDDRRPAGSLAAALAAGGTLFASMLGRNRNTKGDDAASDEQAALQDVTTQAAESDDTAASVDQEEPSAAISDMDADTHVDASPLADASIVDLLHNDDQEVTEGGEASDLAEDGQSETKHAAGLDEAAQDEVPVDDTPLEEMPWVRSVREAQWREETPDSADALAGGSDESLSEDDVYALTSLDGEGSSTVLSEDTLDGLPLAIVIMRNERALFANTSFQMMTGYDDIDTLNERGGLAALLEGAGADELARDARGTLQRGMSIIAADGERFPARAHLQLVPWGQERAMLLALEPLNADPSEDSPYVPEGPLALEAPALAAGTEFDADDAAHLRAQLEDMQSILDIATDGVILLHEDGTIRSINGPASALFGYSKEELRGKSFTILLAHESQRAALDYMHGLADNGVASVLNEGREVLARERAGGFLPLFMTMGRMDSSRSLVAVVRDITPWKQTEQALTEAKRTAEEASSSKSDFLAKISHELRTPLNAIIGFSDLMSEERFGPIGNERYKAYLDDINKSGRHVLDLVNDLLDLSKIEAGKQEMQFEQVDLNEIAADAISMIQPQAARERIIMRSSFESDLPAVVADKRAMKQVIINLLSNSVRFTHAGGLIVASTARSRDGSVQLRIKDTGVGMTSKELEAAMKPFQQVASVSLAREPGTGLGLPLTKALVDANRAEMTIHSEPARGTVVEIRFPQSRVLAS